MDLDLQVVERQLGYLPPNFLAVSARTATGSPIAVQTYPLLKKQKKERIHRVISLPQLLPPQLLLAAAKPTMFTPRPVQQLIAVVEPTVVVTQVVAFPLYFSFLSLNLTRYTFYTLFKELHLSLLLSKLLSLS